MRVFKEISFQVISDLKALDQVLSHFDQAKQSWISQKDWLQCQLALAEGFTNAVRHAHKDLPPDIYIEINIRLTLYSLEVRIWDSGPSFNLQKFLQENQNQNHHLTGHGQGLPILQKIAAQLTYYRTDDERNCLLIVKNFSPL
ncbi:MAG: anti-sigma regulatory factor [Cyanobacteria bacterium P01_G01_bin.49]